VGPDPRSLLPMMVPRLEKRRMSDSARLPVCEVEYTDMCEQKVQRPFNLAPSRRGEGAKEQFAPCNH